MARSTAEESAREGQPRESDSPPARSGLAPWLGALRFCVSRSRFSVLLLVFGLVLLLSDQGRDLLIAYGEDHKTVRLAAGAFLWALSLWGWSRVLLDIRYADHPRHTRAYDFWRKALPRALGSVAFLVVAIGASRAQRYALSVASLAALAVFLAWVTTRRRTTRATARRLRASRAALVARVGTWIDVEEFGPPRYAGLRAALGFERGRRPGPVFRPVAVITVAMALGFVALCAAAFTAPVWLGSSGAMILFFLWSATGLPLASALGYGANRFGFPLISGLVLVAVLSSFSNDNHEIRRRDGGPLPARRSVHEALADWGARSGPPAPDGETPFVVVATAGGGIRAAYWTATVLGELHDNAASFRDRLFAVSGVSGGSVGAAVYRALWPLDPAKLPEPCRPGLAECGQAVLGQEFLGPLAAALLYPDLAQRFVPFPWFPDRARALEASWEAAFVAQTGVDGLRGSLSELSSTNGPHLLLNATWADNGRRIVASDLRFAAEDSTFARSNDQLDEIGHDLALSTAAHNSARFPFVSPPGMWRDRNGKIAGRLQDGGLVENYGAETAIELLEAACREFACPEPGPGPRPDDPKVKRGRARIRPIVVIVTSDPSLPEGFAPSPRVEPLGFGYEVRTTFETFERVRGGRGAETAARLVEWTKARGGESYELRMCSGAGPGASPPLGWALSDAAKERIRGFLQPTGGAQDSDCRSRNVQALGELMALLGTKTAIAR